MAMAVLLPAFGAPIRADRHAAAHKRT